MLGGGGRADPFAPLTSEQLQVSDGHELYVESVGRERITDKHWIYYPEDTVFHRIFVQGNASPHCNPPGGFGLTCEITYSPSKPLPCDGDELVDLCRGWGRDLGLDVERDETAKR